MLKTFIVHGTSYAQAVVMASSAEEALSYAANAGWPFKYSSLHNIEEAINRPGIVMLGMTADFND
jgi:hypothetical protein